MRNHHAQLSVGATAAIAITEGTAPETADRVMVRVDDVDARRARALFAATAVQAVVRHDVYDLRPTTYDQTPAPTSGVGSYFSEMQPTP